MIPGGEASGGAARVRLRVVADPAALARGAAGELVLASEEAVRARGRFTLALAGGETPRALYALLADPLEPFRSRIPWARTHVFFGDERHVPPDHPESNYRMAREALLGRVAVASAHRILGELPDAAEAAERYERELEAFFGAERPPRLDAVLLGLGADGHTASLFPGSGALEERSRWVAAPFVRQLGVHRITLTLPVLGAARLGLFLVAGGDKAAALAKALAPGADGPPASRVRPADLLWLVDRAAASGLPAGAGG